MSKGQGSSPKANEPACARHFVRQCHGISDRHLKSATATDADEACADVTPDTHANLFARWEILAVAATNVEDNSPI